MNTTITKVYAAIVGIPVAAIMIAGAMGGGSSSYDYDDYERDLESMQRDSGSAAGSNVSEAEAYSTLGKYNPCIFIECAGE